jgi:hypothetical protein
MKIYNPEIINGTISGSLQGSVVSASYATTSSYSENGGGGGSQQITGSLYVTGSVIVNNVSLIDEYTAIAYSIAL